ncbi:MAG TPA: oxygenase MpaB family protein [Casimicrobium sp.]|nr:oxygenase MpaB family protein [Casimicrobium sp.]
MTLTDAELDAFTRIADPLADDTAAAIIGPWAADDALLGWAERVARVGAANRLIAQWTSNGVLASWPGPDVQGDPDMLAAMQRYVAEARALPAWADAAKVAHAETLFMDYGPLSCTLLFCASLPECYYLPDLAEVLHITGQLENNTDYRVRLTAAMVFPVMMKGGLTTPEGGGIAQVLKVRLIHAMVRNLILRGNPSSSSGLVAALPTAVATPGNTEARGIFDALLRHGWDVEQQGQPCSQLQLAYTLLTFNYVFLNGMRTLRVPLSASDEEAVLHAWNVSAHSLGVQRELMVENMDDARALFERMQARYAALRTGAEDARPALGGALMDTLAATIKLPVVRYFPIPMARLLCGAKTARAVGIKARSTIIADVFFWITLGLAWVIDAVVRVFRPQFSITRMITRVVGYHLMSEFLMSQTRPLRLPGTLNAQMLKTIQAWSDDPRAASWINRIEDKLTTRGVWGGGTQS